MPNLLKEQLGALETPVSQPDPVKDPPSATPVPDEVNTPTMAEVNKLLEKVDKLVNDLQADVRANVAGLTKKGGVAGPIDTFNHRKACRDTVKNVMNQTRLDDLHDMDGNALVRVQVRATVLPGEDGYDNTLGILRMEVEPPTFDDENPSLAAQVYRNWLDYVNQNINRPPKDVGQWKYRRIRTAVRFLILQEYFQLRYLEVPKTGPDGGPLYETSKTCSGLRVTERRPAECWYLRVALPIGSADHLDIQSQTPDILIDQLRGAAKGIRDPAVAAITADTTKLGETCDVELLDNKTELPRLQNSDRPGKTAQQAAKLAIQIKIWPNTLADTLAISAALSDSFESSRTEMILVSAHNE